MPDTLKLAGPIWWRKRPTGGVAGAAFWLALWFCLFSLISLIPGGTGTFFATLQIMTGLALAALCIPLIWRLIRRKLLWSLRSKLVLTYILIGLAPVVLFVTLVTISSYIAAGQFAIHLADTRLQAELDQMGVENANRAALLARTAAARMPRREAEWRLAMPEGQGAAAADQTRIPLARHSAAFLDGAPLTPESSPQIKTPLGLPPWASELPRGGFRGLSVDAGDLFLIAIDQHRLPTGQMLSLISSVPVDDAVMERIAEGLGRASLIPYLTSEGRSDSRRGMMQTSATPPSDQTLRRTSVFGGTEPPAVNLVDVKVGFLSTIGVTDWDTGRNDSIGIRMTSRPSLLYRQLFGTSLGGVVTNVLRIGLAVLCALFAMIELLALVMAIRLSQTVTSSVADLYEATLRVDRGDLVHRISVEREDQLAELSRSFNRMTGSMQRLLGEQKEKERLQSELTIAQEVQANLFPQKSCDLANLQLHGVCRPARSVSGDYYDFLVFHESARDGQPAVRETGVGIALGDISGKGISAALLMAMLHSAVRAYRFASEELVYSESVASALMASRDANAGNNDELFESPGRILSLLNRHLYRSTQPEKYATLFLAHYKAATATLTYSNAGQLPPLVLSLDGSIRRLDKGGTVVGLMDGMHYEEDRFVMLPGDIMVAYSDGVTEPENDFGDFGEERLMDVVRRYRGQPLHVISAQVMQALDAWIGAEEQPDDITLVLARQG